MYCFCVGLVSKVVPSDQLVAEAVKLGEKISSHSQLIVALCKEAVNAGM
jgi:enoyl-CoA hydratase